MTKEETKKYHREYRQSKIGVIGQMYRNQKASSKKRGHNPPTYTKTELEEWAFSQPKFHILFDNWKRLDFQKNYIPSVDRKKMASVIRWIIFS